jgi:hypothetical protein
MTKKLTLTVEQQIIEQAKSYANKKGRSLSDLIESYLRALVRKEEKEQELSPEIKKLMGSVKLPKEFDYKKELTKSLTEKYQK